MTNIHNRLINDYYNDKTIDKAIYTTLSYIIHIIAIIGFASIIINKIINKSTETFSDTENFIAMSLLMTNTAIVLTPYLKNLKKEQSKDQLSGDTKDLGKRYYNYLIKKEQLIIELKKFVLNAISSLCVVFDIWILYQTLIKKQPISTKFLNLNGQTSSTHHAILLFILAIMIAIVIIMFKNEIVIKHKEKIQTLPETFETKYGINPIN